MLASIHSSTPLPINPKQTTKTPKSILMAATVVAEAGATADVVALAGIPSTENLLLLPVKTMRLYQTMMRRTPKVHNNLTKTKPHNQTRRVHLIPSIRDISMAVHTVVPTVPITAVLIVAVDAEADAALVQGLAPAFHTAEDDFHSEALAASEALVRITDLREIGLNSAVLIRDP